MMHMPLWAKVRYGATRPCLSTPSHWPPLTGCVPLFRIGRSHVADLNALGGVDADIGTQARGASDDAILTKPTTTQHARLVFLKTFLVRNLASNPGVPVGAYTVV